MLLVSFHRESSGCGGVWPQQVSDRGALAPELLSTPVAMLLPSTVPLPTIQSCPGPVPTNHQLHQPMHKGETRLQNSMRPYGMHAFVHSSPAGKGGRYGTQCRNSPAWFLADERLGAAPPPRSGLLPTPLVQAGEGGGGGGGGGEGGGERQGGGD